MRISNLNISRHIYKKWMNSYLKHFKYFQNCDNDIDLFLTSNVRFLYHLKTSENISYSHFQRVQEKNKTGVDVKNFAWGSFV